MIGQARMHSASSDSLIAGAPWTTTLSKGTISSSMTALVDALGPPSVPRASRLVAFLPATLKRARAREPGPVS
jgi:hypothetical protein